MLWMRRLFQRRRLERELDKELRFHLEQHAADLIARGLDPEEALRQAKLALGGTEQVKEECRDARGTRWIDDMWQDSRYALRTLRHRPGFTLAVIATLTVGLGANTAVFSVFDAVLLKTMPYPAPDQMVRLYHADVRQPDARGYLTGPEFLDFRDKASSLVSLASVYTYSPQGADITGSGLPERITLLPVSADYFDVLGIHPFLGRGFTRAEERSESRVVVVSHGIWQRYLGADLGAVSRALTLDGVQFIVVGVMGAGVEDPLLGTIDVWLPEDLTTKESNSWDNHYLSAIGRLRSGTTLVQAREQIDGIARHQLELSPQARNSRANLVPLQEDRVGSARSMLVMLMGAVGSLFLIACVNVASLFLAQSAARQHELAVRAALGEPSWRLLRQLLLESFVLALAGGAVGLVLGRAILTVLTKAAPAAVFRSGTPTLDATVFFYGLSLSVLASLFIGTVPAVRFGRPAVTSVLREGMGGSEARSRGRFRRVLVLIEVSLTLILLIGAGILIKSFHRLQQVDLGLRSGHVLTFQVNLPTSRYSDPESRVRFYDDLQRRLAGIPEVRAVGSISHLPVDGRYHDWGVRRADASDERESYLGANQRVIQGDYFQALGIPLLQGRLLGQQDGFGTPERFVVSEKLARTLFPGSNAIGRSIRVIDRIGEIIGVVRDVPIDTRGTLVPMVYHAHSQFAGDRNWSLIQTISYAGSGTKLVESARRELAAIDPQLVLHDVRPLDEVIGTGVAQERFSMLLLTSFSVVSILLSTVGLYGLLAYSVRTRNREIGIRMALGAGNSAVVAMVIRQGMTVAGAGVALGIVGALALTRGLSSLVFHVSVNDPAVFITAPCLMMGIALGASYFPARIATSADPVETFRSER